MCVLVGAAYQCAESSAANGLPCNDGQFCTAVDTCLNGTCTGTGSPCDDGLVCTQDNCSAGSCGNHDIIDGWCRIDNACFAEEQLNPANPCLECRSDVSQVQWTADDSNICTQFDAKACAKSYCSVGKCKEGNDPKNTPCPDDGNECTSDSCDSYGHCMHTAVADASPCTNEGIACTLDTCQTGQCTHVAQDSPCSTDPAWTFEACSVPIGGCVAAGWGLPFGGKDAGVQPTAVALDPSGNVYVAGYFSGKVDFDPSGGVNEIVSLSVASYDAFVSKFSPDGAYQWTKTLGGKDGRATPTSLGLGPSGYVYVGGSYSGTVDFNPDSGTTMKTSDGKYSAFILRLSSSGTYSWCKDFGPNGDDNDWTEVTALAVKESALFVVGSFEGYADFDPGTGKDAYTSTSNKAAFFSKFTTSGSYQWVKVWKNSNETRASDVAIDGAGQIWIAGRMEGFLDFDPGSGVDNVNCGGCTYLVRYNANETYSKAWAVAGSIDNPRLDVGEGGGIRYLTRLGSVNCGVLGISPEGQVEWSYQWKEGTCSPQDIVAIPGGGSWSLVWKQSGGVMTLLHVSGTGSLLKQVVLKYGTGAEGGLARAAGGALFAAFGFTSSGDIDFTGNKWSWTKLGSGDGIVVRYDDYP